MINDIYRVVFIPWNDFVLHKSLGWCVAAGQTERAEPAVRHSWEELLLNSKGKLFRKH